MYLTDRLPLPEDLAGEGGLVGGDLVHAEVAHGADVLLVIDGPYIDAHPEVVGFLDFIKVSRVNKKLHRIEF